MRMKDKIKKYSDEELIIALLHYPTMNNFKVNNDIINYCLYIDNQKLINLIEKYKIVPFAAHNLMKTDNKFWYELHQKYVCRNKLIITALENIFIEFKEKEITDIVLYENFGVVLLTNFCLGCFSSGDVDFSSNIIYKKNITDILKLHGFILSERRGKKESNIMSTYYNPNLTENGFHINLLWEPVSRRFVLNNSKIKNRLEYARTNSVVADNKYIRLLDTNYLLYFSILHIAIGHYFVISPSYRLYVDIDRLVRLKEIDWEQIFSWAIEDEMEFKMLLVLYLSNLILNTPIPLLYLNKLKNFKRFKLVLFLIYDKDSNSFKLRERKIEKILIDFLSDDFLKLSNFKNRITKKK